MAAFRRAGGLAVAHPSYPDGLPGTVLGDATRAELATDLTGTETIGTGVPPAARWATR